MNCELVRERLHDLIDGEISDAEGAEILRHLDVCPDCREHHDELAAVVAVVRGIPWPKPPANFAAEIADGMKPRSRPWAKLFWMAPVAAAACLLILATLSPGLRPERETLETSRAPVTAEKSAPGPRAGEDAGANGLSSAAEGATSRPAEAIGVGGGGGGAIVGEPGFAGRGGSGPSSGGGGAMPVPAAPRPPGDPAGPAPGTEWAKKRGRTLAPVDLRVRGLEPDAAAGLLLAELENRRARGRDPFAKDHGKRDRDDAFREGREERVITGGDGVPSGLVLLVTPAELEFVRGLLEERAGAEVERRAQANGEPAAEAPAEAKSEDDAEDVVRMKLRVHFDR